MSPMRFAATLMTANRCLRFVWWNDTSCFGSAKGTITVRDDFNDPLPKEIEDLFW